MGLGFKPDGDAVFQQGLQAAHKDHAKAIGEKVLHEQKTGHRHQCQFAPTSLNSLSEKADGRGLTVPFNCRLKYLQPNENRRMDVPDRIEIVD